MSGYKTQVGGNHYTKLKIQPMQYSMGNGLDPLQHTIIKYVTRFRDKAGIDDLHKARHCLDLLIEHEQASAKTANWPESAEERVLPIMQNGNDGAHYADLDMSNPANWRLGDLLEYVGATRDGYTHGSIYELVGTTESMYQITCDWKTIANWMDYALDSFKWHSRPTSA